MWLEVLRDSPLQDCLKEQLVGSRNKILSTDVEQKELRESIAALAQPAAF
jgi:hypothetical protein